MPLSRLLLHQRSHKHLFQRIMSTSLELPSSLTGSPKSALVPPGQCQFTSEFAPAALLKRVPVSDTSSVLRFALPDTSKSLQLSTCACILANVEIDGESVTRPYTPISTNADIGYFDLLVKNYGADAKMSRFMHDMVPTDTMNFKHIEFNVKIQAPFEYDHIVMLVGGTGVTPMIQALHAILGSETKTKVTMLYGSQVSSDILGKEVLDAWAKTNDNFECIDVLSNEPKESEWKGARGFINQSLIEKYVSADTKSIMFFVCGPPPMYNALCGPREEKEITGVLGTMGYAANQVFKF